MMQNNYKMVSDSLSKNGFIERISGLTAGFCKLNYDDVHLFQPGYSSLKNPSVFIVNCIDNCDSFGTIGHYYETPFW
jgi:hypothetical protein